MKYDLIITSVSNKHLKTMAKLLSADPMISIQKAITMLENPPLVYKRSLDEKALKTIAQKLESLGVTYKKIESAPKEDLLGDVKLAGEKVIDNIKKPEAEKRVDPAVAKPLPMKPSATYLSDKNDKIKRGEKVEPVKKIYKNEKKKSSKKSVVSLFFLLFGAVGVILFLLLGSKKQEFKITASTPTMTKTSSEKQDSKTTKKNGLKIKIFANSKKEKKRKEAQELAEKKSQSANFADSAESAEGDSNKMIKFYKIAISLNEKNFNAWTGLVSALKDAGMTTESYEAKERMKEIFGEDMFTIEELVRPYGKLLSFKKDETGVCRLEYKSTSKKKVKMEGDIFLLFRSLNSSLSCSSFSAFASTGKGRGLLVRCEVSSFPNTVSKFLEMSSISFIE